MMRSLFSGVSGLKTHQTRMDVIGNNIANVNTTAYKSQNMVFSDLLYQTTQAASGANANTGRGGINARQIGLGSKTAAINTAITRQGSAQSTNNPWDVMITGESFFIVSSGSQNFFTRDGAFTIDGAGNLVMASTGYTVMGWQYDEDTGDIRSDVVSALQVMKRENLTAGAESTTNGYASGIVDKNDTNVHSPAGKIMSLKIFDGEGYEYSVLMSIHALEGRDGQYYVRLDDIKDSEGVSLKTRYNVENIEQIATFGEGGNIVETKVYPTMDNVTYTDGNPATFKVDYNFDEVLEGYDRSPIMGIAGSTAKIEGIAATAAGAATATKPADNDPLTGGQFVKMSGTVKLDKDTLMEEYGLIYENQKYYYAPKDANGNYDMTKRTELKSDLNDTTNAANWGTVLSQLTGSGNTTTAGPTVTLDTSKSLTIGDDGTVELTFNAVFQAKAAAELPTGGVVYNSKTEKFAATLSYPDATNDPSAARVLEKAYGLTGDDNTTYTINYIAPNGSASITKNLNYAGNMLVFNTNNGEFSYIGGQGQNSAILDFKGSATDMTGANRDLGHFRDVSIDFSSLTNVNNGKVSTAGLDNGDGTSANAGSGRKPGELIGIEIGQDGKIRASYDNGMSKLLGQIAVAKFANASGLAKAGNNLYSTTMNSGEFDGIGQDVTADGEGSMESGILEMSNVDLAGEFTEMITTQRGFQANSRIITTSDTLLEELVNLKR